MSTRNHRNQHAISTVSHKRVQSDHLQIQNKRQWESHVWMDDLCWSLGSVCLTTVKFSSLITLLSRCKMPWSERYVSRSTSSRSAAPRGIQHICFHTHGARCRSKGFLVRMATAIRIPKKRNCTMWSSETAAGFSKNLSRQWRLIEHFLEIENILFRANRVLQGWRIFEHQNQELLCFCWGNQGAATFWFSQQNTSSLHILIIHFIIYNVPVHVATNICRAVGSVNEKLDHTWLQLLGKENSVLDAWMRRW